MNSTVDTSAALAPAAARFDRQHAGTRQQRWMAELEQAMLAQQPGQRPAEQAPQAQDDGNRARPAAAQGTPGAAPVAAARPQAATVGAHAGAAAASGAASTAAQAGQGDTQAADDGMSRHAAAAPRATASAGDATASAWTDPATAGVAAQLMAAAVVPGMSAVPASITTAEPAPEVTIGAAAGARAGSGLAFGLAGAMRQDAAAAEAAVETFEGTATPEAAATDEQYGKNLLHLFHGEDGVQAYIRDAELSGAQMRAVAQALAAELGAGGTRLAGLTINGRRLPVGAANPYEQQDEERPEAQGILPAAQRPLIEEKGAI
ncbi:hypothetical protein E7V67_022450 [[Empedobacter] haloabium]|uniref:Flagellar hook-length control protein FliK n=1 Tax=[Empedobacter] haloabium TaxID=592317 RepID=A0ABZ1UK24_9BURK